jgi:hypothetical protein
MQERNPTYRTQFGPGGGKKCKKKNKKAEDGVSEKVSTNNKNIIIRSVDLNGST